MSLPPSRDLRWCNLAERWLRHADAVARMTRTSSAALIEALAPRPGERLLDLAAGAGDPALGLADAVGPGGRVLASDGVPPMVTDCVERARRAGLPVHGLVARAEQLPLRDGSVDGLSCRFGAMFFDDLPASLREARRVLRPGGRAIWLAWGDKRRNPYFTAAMGALDAVGAPPPEEDADPDAPTVFELSEPDALAGAARAAGLEEVRERRVAVRMEVACEPAGLLDLQAVYSDRVELRVEPLDAALREAARRDLAERVAEWATPEGLSLPGEVVLVTATRGG